MHMFHFFLEHLHFRALSLNHMSHIVQFVQDHVNAGSRRCPRKDWRSRFWFDGPASWFCFDTSPSTVAATRRFFFFFDPEASLLLLNKKKFHYLSDKNDFRIPRQILSRNQNKNLSADWSVRNLRGKTIKTKLIYLDPKSLIFEKSKTFMIYQGEAGCRSNSSGNSRT